MLKLYAQKTKKVADNHIKIVRENGDVIANVYRDAKTDIITLGITIDELNLIVNVSEYFDIWYYNLPIR